MYGKRATLPEILRWLRYSAEKAELVSANPANSAKIEGVNTAASHKFTFSQRLVLAVVPRLVWALLRIVGLTWRFEVIAEEGVTPVLFGEKPGPEIYCFWHQCVLPCTVYFRHPAPSSSSAAASTAS